MDVRMMDQMRQDLLWQAETLPQEDQERARLTSLAETLALQASDMETKLNLDSTADTGDTSSRS